jgi:hypothetical protein
MIAFGGLPSALTESWNGTSWTEVNDLNTARGFTANGAGTSTAALGAGGSGPGVTTNTESWNGTSWTEVNDLNNAIQQNGMRGTQTSALNTGGYDGGSPGQSVKTESWNGTNWTNENSMSIAKQNVGFSAASSSSGLAFGGAQPGGSPAGAATEEWIGNGIVTEIIS